MNNRVSGKQPVFFSFVFAVTKCANEIEEFRCRFLDGKPVIYDKINTSFTYLDKGSELFKVVNVEMQDTIEEYTALAADTVQHQTEYFTAPMGNDIYQFSSFPWVSFTHISHTESGKKDNAVPMIDWGKYKKRQSIDGYYYEGADGSHFPLINRIEKITALTIQSVNIPIHTPISPK